MADSGLSDGNSGQILVSHYLVERHQQVGFLLNASKKHKRDITASKDEGERRSKRPIGRLHHRTRSHKSYKIPRKIRNKKRKPPSHSSTLDRKRCRKHRRRNSTISTNDYFKQGLSDDDSTQIPRKLSNHVWYAKRMKMDRDYYGWQVPLRNNARGLKSLEKLVQRKPLLYDYSYYAPIKLSLSQNDFSRFLSEYTDPDSDLSQSFTKISNKESYAKEFDLLLYESGRFPEGLIGPITLTIRFGQRLEIICWPHPSIRSTVLSLWKSLPSQETDVINVVENVPLARLWLSGKEVPEILRQMLTKFFSNANDAQRNYFLHHALSDERRLENVWKTGQVLSHRIRDPRLLNSSLFPSDINQEYPQPLNFQWPKLSGESPLWSSEQIERGIKEFPCNSYLQRLIASQRFKLWNSVTRLAQQTFSFPADTKISSSSKKSQNIVNTTPADASTVSEIDSVPDVSLLLVRRSSNEWIVVLPCCDVPGLHYFLTERLHVLSLGLQEMNEVLRLNHTLIFPNDYPDTFAGAEYWRRFHHEARVKEEEKKPKAKRCESLLTHSPYNILQKLLKPMTNLEEENAPSNSESVEEVSEQVEIEDKMPEDCIQEDTVNDRTNEDDREDESSSLYHERFLVVRDRKYYSDVIPPKYEVSNSRGGIMHCLGHSDWEHKQSFPPQENDLIIPLPMTPKPVFLLLNVFPTSRGVPTTGALLFQPSVSDLRLFLQHKIHFKLRRLQKKRERQSSSSALPTIASASASSSSKRKKFKKLQTMEEEQRRRSASFDQPDAIPQYDPQLSNEWQGVNLLANNNEAVEERVLVGIVTNGFPHKSNTNTHVNRQRTAAVAMVNIQLLHRMIAERYGRYSHPLTHLLLLFQSPRSQWLRPTTYEFR